MAKLLRVEGRTICCRDTVRKDEDNVFVDILKHLNLLKREGRRTYISRPSKKKEEQRTKVIRWRTASFRRRGFFQTSGARRRLATASNLPPDLHMPAFLTPSRAEDEFALPPA
jgi:hypothetical protein